MSGGSKKAREEQDEIVVMDEYPKPVLLKNSKYLARYPVPKEKKSWQVHTLFRIGSVVFILVHN